MSEKKTLDDLRAANPNLMLMAEQLWSTISESPLPDDLVDLVIASGLMEADSPILFIEAVGMQLLFVRMWTGSFDQAESVFQQLCDTADANAPGMVQAMEQYCTRVSKFMEELLSRAQPVKPAQPARPVFKLLK